MEAFLKEFLSFLVERLQDTLPRHHRKPLASWNLKILLQNLRQLFEVF